MKHIQLGATDAVVPLVGQGQSIGNYKAEVAKHDDQLDNIRLGVGLGMTLLDTAPVYGDGVSERVIGQAIRGFREEVCIATKLRPGMTDTDQVRKSARESLDRLGMHRIDLLQVHWPNPKTPLAETMAAMEGLIECGWVDHIGVSNFSLDELKMAQEGLAHARVATLQVEYNLFDRGIEADVLPYCQRENITVLAYSPLHRGRVANGEDHLSVLREIGDRHDRSPAQVALRWLTSHDRVVVIPNSSNPNRMAENAASADVDLSEDEIERIGAECKPKILEIETRRIRPAHPAENTAYRTVAEALDNPLGLTPSPSEVAEQLEADGMLKPVRVVRIGDAGGIDYDLEEGRLRYWAWVIAFNGTRPIPALLDESVPLAGPA